MSAHVATEDPSTVRDKDTEHDNEEYCDREDVVDGSLHHGGEEYAEGPGHPQLVLEEVPLCDHRHDTPQSSDCPVDGADVTEQLH